MTNLLFTRSLDYYLKFIVYLSVNNFYKIFIWF